MVDFKDYLDNTLLASILAGQPAVSTMTIMRLVEHAYRNGYRDGAAPIGNQPLHDECENDMVEAYFETGFRDEYGTR